MAFKGNQHLLHLIHRGSSTITTSRFRTREVVDAAKVALVHGPEPGKCMFQFRILYKARRRGEVANYAPAPYGGIVRSGGRLDAHP
jgi:hypothetical protein